MGSHTKIIELCGLPACGKTTLVDAVVGQLSKVCRVTDFDTAKNEVLRAPKWKLLCSISLFDMYHCLRFLFYFPRDEKRKDIWSIRFCKNAIIRRYFRKYSQYDIILSSEGMAQSIVSLERGDDLHLDPKFWDAVEHYICTSYDEITVFCKVPIDVAIKRIKSRGRQYGRLDLINLHNPQDLNREYQAEEYRFLRVIDFLKKKGKVVHVFSTDNNTSILVDRFMKDIIKDEA